MSYLYIVINIEKNIMEAISPSFSHLTATDKYRIPVFYYIIVFLLPIMMWFDYYFTEDLKDSGNVDFNFHLYR